VKAEAPAVIELGQVIGKLTAGKPVILRGAADQRGGGDLVIAAEFADPAALNFMAREARGLICLALTEDRCEQLALRPIARGGSSQLAETAMVSIEASSAVTTGISAADRARTIAEAIDPRATPADLVSPGHVFPLRARSVDAFDFPGRVELAIELMGRAGLQPAAVICEILDEDGGLASDEELDRFASAHNLSVVAAEEISQVPARRLADDGRLMRDVMGHFATGVSVVTARRVDMTPVGTTANALSSVSLRPPLLLVCLADDSETLAAVEATRRFALNVLSEGQRHHSERFAAKGTAAHAEEVGFEDHGSGVPIIPDAVAIAVCDVDAMHEAGDHKIVVGRVRAMSHTLDAQPPLLFYRGSYRRLWPEEDDLPGP